MMSHSACKSTITVVTGPLGAGYIGPDGRGPQFLKKTISRTGRTSEQETHIFNVP